MSELIVNGIVSVRDKKPYVQLLTESGLIAQLTMGEARRVAMDILIMASRTEMDAMVHEFFTKSIGAPPQVSTVAMAQFRDFRAGLDAEEVNVSYEQPSEQQPGEQGEQDK